MGRIGKVIKSFIDKLSGSGTNAQVGSVEEFAGDQRTTQYFGPCNEDFAPPESCKTYNEKLGRDGGYIVSLAYHNQLIEPVAVHGERRLFSTSQAGDTIKSEIFLKQDGTILIDNGNVTITVNPSGLLEILTTGNTEITSDKTIINNDVEIVGTLDVTGTITAPEIDGNGINYTTHIHEQGNDSNGDSEVDTEAPKAGP